MKKSVAVVVAALLALLGLVGLAPSAQAYPTPVLTLSLSASKVFSDKDFTATAKANVSCTKITLSWSGQTGSAAGSSVTHTFHAPVVTKPTYVTVYATCEYKDGQTLTSQAQVLVLPASTSGTGNGTGTTGNGSGSIPNTGGPSKLWLFGGLAAVLAGGLAMFAGRRRKADAAQ